MTRFAASLVLAFLLGAMAFSDDEPKLEKKKKPVAEKKEPADADKKAPQTKDKKDGIPDPGATVDAEAEKTAERIVQNSKSAGKRLGEKDPGEDTRKIQAEIIKDIDELLKKLQNPPPPPSSDQKQPMGGGGGGGGAKSKSQGGGSSSSREERRQRSQAKKESGEGQGGKSQARNEPKKGDSGEEKGNNPGSPMGGSPKPTDPKATAKFAEIYKDVWGHLPEKVRREMDAYFREQFMPRYQEMLRQYYSSLAEKKR